MVTIQMKVMGPENRAGWEVVGLEMVESVLLTSTSMKCTIQTLKSSVSASNVHR